MRILKLWTFLEYENVLVRWTNRWDLDGPVSFWNAGITGSRASNMEWTYSRYLELQRTADRDGNLSRVQERGRRLLGNN